MAVTLYSSLPMLPNNTSDIGEEKQAKVSYYFSAMNREWFNVYHNEIGGSVTELQCWSFVHQLYVISYFVFDYQSHYSGICGQRVNRYCSIYSIICSAYITWLIQFDIINCVSIVLPSINKAVLISLQRNLTWNSLHNTIYSINTKLLCLECCCISAILKWKGWQILLSLHVAIHCTIWLLWTTDCCKKLKPAVKKYRWCVNCISIYRLFVFTYFVNAATTPINLPPSCYDVLLWILMLYLLLFKVNVVAWI